jgi:hypothetical protein
VVLRPKELEIRGKKYENCIRAKKTKQNKYCAMKLSQIRRRIELCMREMILRFEMNLEIYVFLDSSFIHIRILISHTCTLTVEYIRTIFAKNSSVIFSIMNANALSFLESKAFNYYKDYKAEYML